MGGGSSTLILAIAIGAGCAGFLCGREAKAPDHAPLCGAIGNLGVKSLDCLADCEGGGDAPEVLLNLKELPPDLWADTGLDAF